jgi:hypothetical protein
MFTRSDGGADMNAINHKRYRLLTVLLLVAAGLLTAVITGCGGGGGGGDGASYTGPTLAITADNGEAVAATVTTGILAMFEITEGAEGPILEPTAGTLSLLRKVGTMPGIFAQVPIQGTEPCDVSGTISVSGNLADPTTITVGDTITGVFENCDDGDGFVIDGRLAMTVAAIQGDIFFDDVFLLTLDMVLTDLAVTSDGESITGNGDLAYTLDALDFPAILTALSGTQLRIAAAGEAVTFRNFDQTLEVDLGVVPTSYTADANGRLDSSVLGGSVDYGTVETIQAIGEDNPPYTGEILVSGADASAVRIVVVSEEVVRLEIDVNGDGVVDEFIDTTWAALIGELSS